MSPRYHPAQASRARFAQCFHRGYFYFYPASRKNHAPD